MPTAVTARLARAVREARRIRKNLMRARKETDLGGDCGYASVLLADALCDVDSLRHTVDIIGRYCTPHVWNEIDGVVVDVTATQFNDNSEREDAGDPTVRGVLVTPVPRIYHGPIAGRGRKTLTYLIEMDWYNDRDHHGLRAAMERLRISADPVYKACMEQRP